MKIIDCYWEVNNLGKRVCEITIDVNDKFDESDLLEKTQNYDYLVVKVPMNRPAFNFGLSRMGYTMIETQLNLSKNYKDFDFDDRLIKRLLLKVDERLIVSEKDLDNVLDRMTLNMFSTDRIYLDPFFNKDSSMIRYSNWVRNEFYNHTAIVKEFIYDGKSIGFGMNRERDGVLYGLLGGIYEEEQSEGYGLLTACISFLTAKKRNNPFLKIRTAISSNNVPMMQIYNYLNFKIDNLTYVFIKHNN